MVLKHMKNELVWIIFLLVVALLLYTIGQSLITSDVHQTNLQNIIDLKKTGNGFIDGATGFVGAALIMFVISWIYYSTKKKRRRRR